MDEELRKDIRTEDIDVEIMSMHFGMMRAGKFTHEDTAESGETWAEDRTLLNINI